MKRITLFMLLSCLALSASVRIDVGETGEPISPYIYGQFIEHLGRCIYDGIWAEILQDRKFYYPITEEFSPWTLSPGDTFWNTGPYRYLSASPWEVLRKGTVSMDSSHSWVGAHTPLITVPGDGRAAGIKQARLMLKAGVDHDCRIVYSGTVPVIVRLVSSEGTLAEKRLDITPDFTTATFTFPAVPGHTETTLKILARDQGRFSVGAVSLMPADHIDGWRPDVLALMQELDSPVYRWPGGNFVSGYNWRDGIGPRDQRPPRKNPAWKGVESNDVGLHEYMQLMDILDSEPFIAVNTGLGTVEEVAEEVEYVNLPADTPLGSKRAENGHPEPFDCQFWAVGNEMYGDWQLGHMPLEKYVEKHKRVVEAMWAVDSTIELIAVGNMGEWSRTMLRMCADHMDLISEHIYCREAEPVQDHIWQMRAAIRERANAHRQYRREIPGLDDKDIRIALDEWNYWYGDYIYGELGVRYHLKDALGIAGGLHEYFRNSDMFYMANYAQTVNVIGCIKTSPTDAVFAATGLPLKLYRQQFGSIPVEVTDAPQNVDIAAALTGDGQQLTIALVNAGAEKQSIPFTLLGFEPSEQAQAWVISGDDPQLYNEPDAEPRLDILEKSVKITDHLPVPGYGIMLVKMERK
ncbi:MAG: alpha-L-arabinofuranosidase C-terminal domain-containing protein [candidate division KSB1 bacterium]|nr:alpha-L-arabinofuranosidase C-terminal domain-containing protein [candidate division KSB1 bacterium]